MAQQHPPRPALVARDLLERVNHWESPALHCSVIKSIKIDSQLLNPRFPKSWPDQTLGRETQGAGKAAPGGVGSTRIWSHPHGEPPRPDLPCGLGPSPAAVSRSPGAGPPAAGCCLKIHQKYREGSGEGPVIPRDGLLVIPSPVSPGRRRWLLAHPAGIAAPSPSRARDGHEDDAGAAPGFLALSQWLSGHGKGAGLGRSQASPPYHFSSSFAPCLLPGFAPWVCSWRPKIWHFPVLTMLRFPPGSAVPENPETEPAYSLHPGWITSHDIPKAGISEQQWGANTWHNHGAGSCSHSWNTWTFPAWAGVGFPRGRRDRLKDLHWKNRPGWIPAAP